MFKPFGDVFLNLLFTIVVPLVFFSIASAVAGMGDMKRLGKIMLTMLAVFLATGVLASIVMLIGVWFYPPAPGLPCTMTVQGLPCTMTVQGLRVPLMPTTPMEQIKVSEQIVKALTVSDFSDIFSKKNMLALILFAILIGLAASSIKEKGKPFVQFLLSANDVMMKAISTIMLYAPIGLGAYFAYLVGVFGPELLGTYVRAMVLYYPIAILYFFVGFSFYAYFAGRRKAVIRFWSNIIPASLTALATGSSMAAIPMNLEAAEKNKVPKDISEVVIPIGATIHMDGSCLSAILKIALLFGIFHMDFTGIWTMATAVGVALLSGTVMAGIPGGGFLGELMIVTLYGFPIEALPIISMIGTLADPPATMVNAVGDNVASMMVARILGGKNWME